MGEHERGLKALRELIFKGIKIILCDGETNGVVDVNQALTLRCKWLFYASLLQLNINFNCDSFYIKKKTHVCSPGMHESLRHCSVFVDD